MAKNTSLKHASKIEVFIWFFSLQWWYGSGECVGHVVIQEIRFSTVTATAWNWNYPNRHLVRELQIWGLVFLFPAESDIRKTWGSGAFGHGDLIGHER